MPARAIWTVRLLRLLVKVAPQVKEVAVPGQPGPEPAALTNCPTAESALNRAYRYSPLTVQPPPSAYSRPPPTTQPSFVVLTVANSGVGVNGGSEQDWLNLRLVTARPPVT